MKGYLLLLAVALCANLAFGMKKDKTKKMSCSDIGLMCYPKKESRDMNCVKAICPEKGHSCCFDSAADDDEDDDAPVNILDGAARAVADPSCTKKRCSRAGGFCSREICEGTFPLESDNGKRMCKKGCYCCKASNPHPKPPQPHPPYPYPPHTSKPNPYPPHPPHPEEDTCPNFFEGGHLGCDSVHGVCRKRCGQYEKQHKYSVCSQYGCKCCVEKEDKCEEKGTRVYPEESFCKQMKGTCRSECKYGESEGYHASCKGHGCKCCMQDMDVCEMVDPSGEFSTSPKYPCQNSSMYVATCRTRCQPGEHQHWQGHCLEGIMKPEHYCVCCFTKNVCRMPDINDEGGYCEEAGGICKMDCESSEFEISLGGCFTKAGCKCCAKTPEPCALAPPEPLSECAISGKGSCNLECPVGTIDRLGKPGCTYPCKCCETHP